MTRTNLSGIVLIVFSVLFWAGCNDAFRPIANPIPEPGPDPQLSTHVLVTSTNTTGVPGALTTIDVPGDTIASVQYAGQNPVETVVSAGRAFVLNVDSPSLTSLVPANFNFPPVTIPFPLDALPVSAHSAQPGVVWVAERSPRNKVGRVQVSSETLSSEIAVGSDPVAVVQIPDTSKIYVANRADGTVSVILNANQAVVGTIPVGTNPVDLVASSDSRFVFVANEGSSDITVIDTSNDTTAAETIPLPGSPGCAGAIPCVTMTFDPGLKRLYVASAASNTVTIIRADQPVPTLPSLITSINVNTDPTCVGTSPRQVAVLPDGSRAYVTNAGSDNVCVVNTLNNTIMKSIPVGANPVSVGASADGTKVYTANSGSNNISVIRTDFDQEVTDNNGAPFRLPAPKLDPNCSGTCPLQTPIQVTR